MVALKIRKQRNICFPFRFLLHKEGTYVFRFGQVIYYFPKFFIGIIFRKKNISNIRFISLLLYRINKLFLFLFVSANLLSVVPYAEETPGKAGRGQSNISPDLLQPRNCYEQNTLSFFFLLLEHFLFLFPITLMLLNSRFTRSTITYWSLQDLVLKGWD